MHIISAFRSHFDYRLTFENNFNDFLASRNDDDVRTVDSESLSATSKVSLWKFEHISTTESTEVTHAIESVFVSVRVTSGTRIINFRKSYFSTPNLNFGCTTCRFDMLDDTNKCISIKSRRSLVVSTYRRVGVIDGVGDKFTNISHHSIHSFFGKSVDSDFASHESVEFIVEFDSFASCRN